MLAEVAVLRRGIKEIDTALAAISGDAAVVAPVQSGSRINDSILEAVKSGAGTPAEIHEFLARHLSVETSKHSVSTRLSKLKNEGHLDHDGTRWVLPKKVEGPAAPTAEPPKQSGPVTGREGGYPPASPEGSIPSGSTVSHRSAPSRELDDDIPF